MKTSRNFDYFFLAVVPNNVLKSLKYDSANHTRNYNERFDYEVRNDSSYVFKVSENDADKRGVDS